MTKIDVLWRTRHKGLPPRPIKLQIPGWAGHDLNHGDGATPQPWHCPPFVDGSTYGLELLYPFDYSFNPEQRRARANGRATPMSCRNHLLLCGLTESQHVSMAIGDPTRPRLFVGATRYRGVAEQKGPRFGEPKAWS